MYAQKSVITQKLYKISVIGLSGEWSIIPCMQSNTWTTLNKQQFKVEGNSRDGNEVAGCAGAPASRTRHTPPAPQLAKGCINPNNSATASILFFAIN